MLHDILPAALAALHREAELITQALARVTEAGARRDALTARSEVLAKLIATLTEKPSLSVRLEAAGEIERIARRLSANVQNAEEAAKLLALSQDLMTVFEGEAAGQDGDGVAADPVSGSSKASIETDMPEAETVSDDTKKDEIPVVSPTAAENAAPAQDVTADLKTGPAEPGPATSSKPEAMEPKMNQIRDIEAATDVTEDSALLEETTEEQSGRKSDEALAGAWMGQNMPKMNKVARNRYGDGKEVCLVANRSASRDQRNVIANLPAEALDWARSARRPVKLVLFIRYSEEAAGTSMRVVTANLTTAVALATPAKGAKATISLWDEFGDVEKANGVLACEGSAENALTDIQVVSTVVA